MYNPVNMKIDDMERLYQKDLREKNKKARYEVKYDVEALVRREALAEQDKEAEIKLNKISGMRYREEMQRGFNIVNGYKLEGKANQYMMEQVSKSNPVNTWTKAVHNANTNDDILQEIERIKEEEYHKKLKERGINEEFKQIELDKLKGEGERALLKKLMFERRSKRLRKILDRSPLPHLNEGKTSILTASKRASSQIQKDFEIEKKSHQKTESKHSKLAHSLHKSPIAMAEELQHSHNDIKSFRDSQAKSTIQKPALQELNLVSERSKLSTHRSKAASILTARKDIRTGGFSSLGTQIINE